MVRGVLAGDPKAENEFFLRYEYRLYRTAVHFLGASDPDSEDLVQETFLIAFRKLAEFDFRFGLYTWLNRICANLCLERIRKRQRAVQLEDEAFSAGLDRLARRRHDEGQGKALGEERLAMVKAALELMDGLCRNLIQLRDFEGLAYIGLAKRLGLPIGTVMSRLARCRKKLKQIVLAGLDEAVD